MSEANTESRVVDLHTHSNASDGILSPEALVSRANLHGVNFLALTDHDNVDGISEAKTTAEGLGMTLLPGIEFSSDWNNQCIHVVGLGIDPQSSIIVDAVKAQKQARADRAIEIGTRLDKAGFPGCYEGARELSGGEIIGRPHFARFMVSAGYCRSDEEAFKKYLGSGKIGDVKQCWPEVAQVVEWINGGDGVPVLAHPEKYKMTRTKVCRLVENFIEAGGQALEVINGRQTPNITAKLAQIAQKYELMASCGSDFHVPNQKWQELGGFGKLPAFCEPVWQVWA